MAFPRQVVDIDRREEEYMYGSVELVQAAEKAAKARLETDEEKRRPRSLASAGENQQPQGVVGFVSNRCGRSKVRPPMVARDKPSPGQTICLHLAETSQNPLPKKVAPCWHSS